MCSVFVLHFFLVALRRVVDVLVHLCLFLQLFLTLSLSLFSGVALKRAFGFVGSACGHKSKREEKRKLHWTWERCCICLCKTFYINDYLLICMLWTWKITDVGCLIIFLFFDHLFNVFTIHFWWLYLLHNMQLIKCQILYLIVSQNIYLQSQRCLVVRPLKESLGCSACLLTQNREKEYT